MSGPVRVNRVGDFQSSRGPRERLASSLSLDLPNDASAGSGGEGPSSPQTLPAAGAGRGGAGRPFRWNISWKVLLMGFLVVWQVAQLLMVHPTESLERRSPFTISRLFGGKGFAQDEDVLSGPVAADYPVPDVRVLAVAAVTEAAEETTSTPPRRTAVSEGAATEHPRASGAPQLPLPVPAPGGSARLWGTATRRCTPLAALFGMLGAAAGLVMSCFGAGIGIARAGRAVGALAMHRRSEVFRGMLPVVMSELLAIYGLITGVSITLGVANNFRTYPLAAGFLHLAAGISVGGSCWAAGAAIGHIGAETTLALIQTREAFAPSVLLLIFCEALALYGLIGGLLLSSQATTLTATIPCKM